MEYIKTVTYFVSGSDKFFDVFKATPSNIELVQDSGGRKQISLQIGDKTYKGLHSKGVLEYLTENEGSECYIVFWRTPKNDYLICYAWNIWDDAINGKSEHDVKELAEREYKEEGEAFLYLWIDKSNDMKYLGKHKGTLDDGYVCSNERMLEEHSKRPTDFVRTILAWGTDKEMHELETLLLIQLKASSGGMYYNLSNNLRK
jgi:hypothetical protein